MGCVLGSFVGNAVGAAIKNRKLEDITEDLVEQAMNLTKQAVCLEIGQIEHEFEMNIELMNAL